ncbi:MAG: hypothetical protein HKN92_10450 [Chitinophagales bacterium]|nr:hypothetical protein [Chitinophagales bacterium]
MEVLIALLISFGILSADESAFVDSNSEIISIFQDNQEILEKHKLTDEESSEIARIFDWNEEG